VRTWAHPPSTASTAMATPALIRPVTFPPGSAATAAPLSPATKAPAAATRVFEAGGVVATDFTVVDEAGPLVADDDEEPAGASDVVSVELDTGADDVDDAAFLSGPELFEQPAPMTSMTRTRTRRFTAAHDRARDQTLLSTSAINSPISDGLRPTRQPAFSSASILAAAVPFEPETIAPAWPIFLPGGAVTPAT